MVSRAQLAHAALVVLGLALAGGGIVLLDTDEYTHEVVPIADGEVPDDATVLAFENLSTDGRSVFQAALDSSDGVAAVSADERAPEFSYGDASGDHYVTYRGEYYRVTTAGGGVLSGADEILAWILLAFGSIAVLVGSVDLYRHRSGSA